MASQLRRNNGFLEILARSGQIIGGVGLGIVAAGLFAFGMFGIVQAIYRRIRTPDFDDAKEHLPNTGLFS